MKRTMSVVLTVAVVVAQERSVCAEVRGNIRRARPMVQEVKTADEREATPGREKTKKALTLIVKYDAAALSKAGVNAPASSQLKAAATVQADFGQKISGLGLGKPRQVFEPALKALAQAASSPAGKSPGIMQASSSTAPGRLSTSTADRIADLQRRFPKRAKRAPESFVPPSPNLAGFFSVVVPKGRDLTAVIAAVKKIPGVKWAYPSREYKTSSAIPGAQAYNNAWGIPAIAAPSAWTTTLGDGITVGINDTGIYYKHAALASNVWSNPGEIAGNCIDDDGNGYVDDQFGWDFTQSSIVSKTCSASDSEGAEFNVHQPFDCNGHGSHVSGTIAAVDADKEGVTGVAPGVKLLAAKGLTDEGAGSTEGLANAIIYLTDNGADVINNSWGAGPVSYDDPLLTDAIRYATAAGVVNVFAAGNESSDMTLAHPANMKEVITVGAIDAENKRADFSNYGARVDVVAPGVYVNSSFPNGCGDTESDPVYGEVPVVSHDYTQISGTSMATPHVVGVVALVLAANPSLRVDEVRSIVRATADDLGASGLDPYFGAGRVNAKKAVAYALANERMPLIDLQLGQTSVSRSANGKITPIQFKGTVSGVSSYQIAIRPWTSTAPASRLLTGTKPIRNGVIGSADVSKFADGKYVVELRGTTSSGRQVSRAEALSITPKSTVIASIAGYPSALGSPASFNGQYATWEPYGDFYSSSDRSIESGTVQIMKRGQTNSVVESYQIGKLPGTMYTSDLFLAGSTRLAGIYLDNKLSGVGVDAAILPRIDGSRDNAQIISTGLPAVEALKKINTFGRDVGRFGLIWKQQVGLGTIENRLFGYRIGSNLIDESKTSGNGGAVALVTSPNKSYYWGAIVAYSAADPKSPGTLVAFEGIPDPVLGTQLDTLVKFDLGAAKLASSRKVLFTSKPSADVDSIDYGFGLGCMFAIDPTVGKGSSLTLVDIVSGAKLLVADQPYGFIGLCRVPQSNFVTYLQISLGEGTKLVGYDVKTGKSGAITLPVGADIRSLTTTGDGNLSWKEYYGAGSRLVEFDVTAFRSGINAGTVPKF